MRLSEMRAEVLAGLTAALSLVPEVVGFALVAHVNPLTGLYAAFIICLIAAIWGGRPGMISGAAGSMAVVSAGLVLQHGVEYLFATIVLTGILQMLFAWFRLGKLIRMVPHPVMLGFVNGLAIVIASAQLQHFHIHTAEGTLVWMPPAALLVMLGLVAVTAAVTVLLPRLTKIFPSALAGILVATACAFALGIHTRTVGDLASIHGAFPRFHLPQVPYTWETLRIIFPYALVLATIGLVEDPADIESGRRDNSDAGTPQSGVHGAGRRQSDGCALRWHGRLRHDRSKHDQPECRRTPQALRHRCG